MGKLSEEDWRALDAELRAQAIEILRLDKLDPTSDGDQRLTCPRRMDFGLEALLSGFQIFLAVMVILLILLHSGQGRGLSGAFGVGAAGGPFGGGSLVERNLDRWTIFFCVLFVDERDRPAEDRTKSEAKPSASRTARHAAEL